MMFAEIPAFSVLFCVCWRGSIWQRILEPRVKVWIYILFYTSLRWLGFRGNDGGMPGDWKLPLSLVCKVWNHFNLSFDIKTNVSTLINIFIKVFWLGILFKQMILNVLKLLVISIIALKWLKQRRGRLSTTLDIGRSTSGELKRGFAGYTVCGFF